jgi:integration host factor subunit alpha
VETLELKPKLVKSDLVEQVYKRVGFTRKEAEEAVNVLFKEIKTELASGENVRIAGFASFYLKNKKARITRNPQTGETVIIRSRKVLTFKPSKQLLTSTDSSLSCASNRCSNISKNKFPETTNAFDSPRELMTEIQVVEWLQLKNVRQLRYLCGQNSFPYLPINKKEKRFDKNEIVAWMKKNRRIAQYS